MGLVMTCDKCKKSTENREDFYDICIHSFNSFKKKDKHIVLCEECAKKIIGETEIEDTKIEIEEEYPAAPIKKNPDTLDINEIENEKKDTMFPDEKDNPFAPFIGTTLREFLRTDMYQESFNNFIFKNANGDEIMDITPYVRRHIVFMEQNEDDITITMSDNDYVPDEPDEFLDSIL